MARSRNDSDHFTRMLKAIVLSFVSLALLIALDFLYNEKGNDLAETYKHHMKFLIATSPTGTII